MQMNLKTTLNAYPKLSSSVLKDYVSKEELESLNYVDETELRNSLGNYVTEAPANYLTYGRKDKTWVPIEGTPPTNTPQLFWGTNQLENIINESQVLDLQNSLVLAENMKNISVSYDSDISSYFWVVYTKPIKSITLGTMSLIADYNSPNTPFMGSTGYNYYCYRIADKLLPGIQPFTIILEE